MHFQVWDNKYNAFVMLYGKPKEFRYFQDAQAFALIENLRAGVMGRYQVHQIIIKQVSNG